MKFAVGAMLGLLTLGFGCVSQPTITVINEKSVTLYDVTTCGTTIASLAAGAQHVFMCADGSHPTSYSCTPGGTACTTAAAPTVNSEMNKTANINDFTVVSGGCGC